MTELLLGERGSPCNSSLDCRWELRLHCYQGSCRCTGGYTTSHGDCSLAPPSAVFIDMLHFLLACLTVVTVVVAFYVMFCSSARKLLFSGDRRRSSNSTRSLVLDAEATSVTGVGAGVYTLLQPARPGTACTCSATPPSYDDTEPDPPSYQEAVQAMEAAEIHEASTRPNADVVEKKPPERGMHQHGCCVAHI